MKKILLPILLILAGFCRAQTLIGSTINVWATIQQLNALEAQFESIINTNGITAGYADEHYLAINWSNNVLNAQVTASNAFPTASWNAVSNSIVYTNVAAYTAAVALAGTALQPNTTATVSAVSFGTNSVLKWNGEERKQSLEYTHPDGGTVSINGETYAMWKNIDDVTISNGQPVCLFSGAGRIGSIKLADADDPARNKVVGVYTGDAALPVNGIGRITQFGAVESFALPSLVDGGSVLEGAEISLSTNRGFYTTNTYSAPIESITVGFATYVQANNADLQVAIHCEKAWTALDSRYSLSGKDQTASNLVIYGNVTLTNTVWDDMSISALQLNSGGAAPQLLVYTNGNSTGAGVRAVNYDDGDSAFGQIQFSHQKKRNTDVYPHIHWSTIDNRSAITNISFRLDCIYAPIHGLLTNLYSSTVVVSGTNAFYHQLSGFTPFGSNVLSESSIVQFEITCVQDGGANDKLFIHDIDFHYQIDKLGTDGELPPNGL